MKRLKILRRWFARKLGLARLMCLALLVVFAGARLWDPPPIQELRLRTFDMFQLIDPRHKTARPVTIVDIDDKSLARLGQWPWPRTRIADLIQNLTSNGAVAIGFDVVFSEADRLNPDLVASQMRYLDDATRAKLRELPTNDQILADAIKRSRVVLGETGQRAISSEIDKELPFTGVATVGEDGAERFLFEFPGLLRNVPVIEKVAAGRGLFSIKTERDGLIRRVPMIMRAQGMVMPSLSLEILRVITGTPTLLVRTDKTGVRGVRLKGVEIPTDRNGQLWVHYARQDPSIYVSAADVLDNTVPPAKIAGKLVLVGTSAVGLNDIKTTPVSSTMPGVEIHAQVLESVLSGAVISQPNYALGVELIAALVIGLLVIIFTPNLGPVRLVLAGAMFAAILVGVSWFFYAQYRYLIDFTYPLLSTTAIYLTLIFASFVREQRQRVQIRGMFAQYMSPVLVEQLAQSPEKLVLGGEEREMTIMFSDVRGFTTISESYKHDPQGLITLMNRFLTPLTDVIIDQKGYIDKYMGDAIMAFWNAPARRCRARGQRLRGRDPDAGADRRGQQGARGGSRRRRPRLHPAQCRHRPQHRHRRGRQHGLRPEEELFGARRQREPGLAPGGTVEGIRFPDHRRLQDRARRQGQVRDPRARLHHGQGQDRAGGDLRRRRPRGRDAFRLLPAPAQRHHRDARLLPQPRLAGRAGRHRARPSQRGRRHAGKAVQAL
ncbi:adenylate cyclase [Bradyrhizobium diazoefficiens]